MVRGVRISLFICYDLRFPELFRAVAPDVDAMFVIANWPAGRRPHWDALLPARAIENQCYVVGVNRVGQDGSGHLYSGDSAMIDPRGAVEAVPPGASAVVTVLFKGDALVDFRAKFPVAMEADAFELKR